MKKILTAIAAALLLLPAACFAGYVIHLKDGTRFVTDQYFEEGDQIKFKRYGGLFGIAKDRVREIEETEAPTEPAAKEETSAKTEVPPATAEADKQDGSEMGIEKPDASKQVEGKRPGKGQEKAGELTKDQKNAAEKIEGKTVADFLEEKRCLDAEIKRVYSEFNEAKASADKDAQRKHFNKLKFLREKLTELEREVTAANGGKVPDWWNEYR